MMPQAEATASQALLETEGQERTFESDDVLIGVARVWAKSGKFAEATRLADRLGNIYVRPNLLLAVAVALGEAVRLADGLQLLQTINEKSGRDLAVRRFAWDLRFIALERGEEGALIDALRLVESEEERPGSIRAAITTRNWFPRCRSSLRH